MINYDLTKIKAIIFDVDGVLSCQTVAFGNDAEPIRTINIKDGYAIQFACKMNYHLAIITGGSSESIRKRYEYLGVKDIFMQCSMKINTYEAYKLKYGLKDEEILYMGDDIPDYDIMMRCGCPCCPKDACDEIKRLSIYISDKEGGCGCVRDVVEQVMKANNKWMTDKKAFGW